MKNTKIITFAQEKGGSGKTSIAAHFALALSKKSLKCALIDIDPSENLFNWYKLRTKSDINFPCLATNIWNLGDEIKNLQNNHKLDIIVIDTAPHNPLDKQMALKFSDLAIIPVQPSILDVDVTHRTLKMVSNDRIPHRILWNRILGDYSVMLNFPKINAHRLTTIIPNHASIPDSMLTGQTIIEKDPDHIASNIFMSLADEIIDLLLPQEEVEVTNHIEMAI